MKEKDNIQEELASFAPLLAQQKRKPMPFKVPDSYFEKLEQQVMETVQATSEPTSPTTVRSLGFWVTRVAAILLVGLGAFWLLQPAPTTKDLFADLSTEEINQYITNNLDEFDEDLLIEETIFLRDRQVEEFSEKEIQLYLKENLDDLDLMDLDYLL